MKLQELKMPGIYVIPSEKNRYLWCGIIFVRQGYYQGGIFRFVISIPESFPNCDTPKIIFHPSVFHPQVNASTGELDTCPVFPKWKNTNHIYHLLLYMRRCFYRINASNPVNQEAANLFNLQLEDFKVCVGETVQRSLNGALLRPKDDDDAHSIIFSDLDPHLLTQVLNAVRNPVKNLYICITQINRMANEELLQCYNKGCGKKFQKEENDEKSCMFHPGDPFFHDAYKGWSCCKKKCIDFTEFLNIKGCTISFHNPVKPPEPEKQVVDKSTSKEVLKKTTDFTNFLEQQGCKEGEHCWMKQDSSKQVQAPPRYDWHQTGTLVVVSVYAKNPDPEKSIFKASPVKLEVQLTYSGGKVFNLDLILQGVIDTQGSIVTLSPSKVEVKMKKAQIMTWANLGVPKQIHNQVVEAAQKDLALRDPELEPVDLSDLWIELDIFLINHQISSWK
ncbi:unnamed protein product, partial [Darwinula stevensoni]